MDEQVYEQAISEYERLYSEMTPKSLEQFPEIFAEDAVFQDPFNEVRGVPAIRNIFEHMYQVCEEPRFNIISRTRSGNISWLHWIFDCRVKQRDIQITGASMVMLSDEGKVLMHIDYWDAASQLYEKLPVIGWLMKKLRQMFAVPQNTFKPEMMYK